MSITQKEYCAFILSDYNSSMPRNNVQAAPLPVQRIRAHLNMRKHRAKKQGKPAPTYAQIESVFTEAGICPTDKRYRLETCKLTEKLYLVKKREHMTEEELRLHIYVIDKTKNARLSGIQFLLGIPEVQAKLNEAGITIWDVGKGTKESCGKDYYQLCRVNDEGDYDHTSSFKTQRENIAERDTSNIGMGLRNSKGKYCS